MLKIQHQGQEAFDLAQKVARERVTRLVETLRDVTRAYEKEGTMAERKLPLLGVMSFVATDFIRISTR